MRISISRKIFLDGLGMAKDFVSKQTHLPILKSIKLTARDGTIRLHATNLSTGIMVLLKDLSVLCEGEAVCDALKLLEIVRELPETSIQIEIDKGANLKIDCQNCHFKLLTQPPEDFPPEPEIPADNLSPIPDQFFDSLRKIKYAALRNSENNLYKINCLYLGSDTVATDGYRVGLIRRNLGFDKALLPLEFVSLLLKGINRFDDKNILAGCFENTIFFKTDGAVFFSRLIQGDYPNYDRAIPVDSPRFASIDKARLSEAVKRTILMSERDFRVRLEFNPSSLALSSFTPNFGDASDQMEIKYESQTNGEEPFVIAVNGRYFLEMLEALDNETIVLWMSDEESAIKVDEDEFVHILMPIHLG